MSRSGIGLIQSLHGNPTPQTQQFDHEKVRLAVGNRVGE